MILIMEKPIENTSVITQIKDARSYAELRPLLDRLPIWNINTNRQTDTLKQPAPDHKEDRLTEMQKIVIKMDIEIKLKKDPKPERIIIGHFVNFFDSILLKDKLLELENNPEQLRLFLKKMLSDIREGKTPVLSFEEIQTGLVEIPEKIKELFFELTRLLEPLRKNIATLKDCIHKKRSTSEILGVIRKIEEDENFYYKYNLDHWQTDDRVLNESYYISREGSRANEITKERDNLRERQGILARSNDYALRLNTLIQVIRGDNTKMVEYIYDAIDFLFGRRDEGLKNAIQGILLEIQEEYQNGPKSTAQSAPKEVPPALLTLLDEIDRIGGILKERENSANLAHLKLIVGRAIAIYNKHYPKSPII